MKKLTITALLIVSLFTVTPAAQAADWSNGKFSCDLEVTKLAPWWEFYNWGKESTMGSGFQVDKMVDLI